MINRFSGSKELAISSRCLLMKFLRAEKFQLPLIYLRLPTPFQAYDEGSIPFTRSKTQLKKPKFFRGLSGNHRKHGIGSAHTRARLKGAHGAGATVLAQCSL